jgi:hypothetical protein
MKAINDKIMLLLYLVSPMTRGSGIIYRR